MKLFNLKISEHTFVFYGAGAAGVGIADLIALDIVREDPSLSLDDAKRRIFLVDSKGLVTSDREGLIEDHKVILPYSDAFIFILVDSRYCIDAQLPYAHPFAGPKESVLKSHCCGEDLLNSIIQELRPSVLIGVSAQGGAFNEVGFRLFCFVKVDKAREC